jgi:putative hemolysin
MNTKKLLPCIIAMALTAWLLAGCGAGPTGTASAPATAPAIATPAEAPAPPPVATPAEAPAAGAPGLANPASVFCEENGGRLEIRDTDSGQVGWCIFPDGRECEEWAFLRGECAVRSAYQPPDPGTQAELADALGQALGMAVTTAPAPFQDYIRGEIGAGWQATVTGTGLDFENHVAAAGAVREALESRGWQEDMQYAAGGPTGDVAGYRRADTLCLASAGWEPAPDADCPPDQPISACELAPGQKLYTITLTCAQAITAPAASGSEPDAARIQFAPGGISAQVQGALAPQGVDRYVLGAMAGQQMTLTLYTMPAGDPAAPGAILIIWGADGTVLISDHAGATTWTGRLPVTEDYFVDVRSAAETPVDYMLEVVIPPATSGPATVPPTFEAVLGQLESTGVPPMLPPGFPGAEGLPPVSPYVLTAGPGEYEISLDFGADCRGAGACHYGSLAGKQVESNEPASTTNFEFDATRAQPVALAGGMQGYFVEGLCGANCDDSKVFWIAGGFQYMVGMKAGSQADVVDLANATLENSTP